ncbi:hypothetical protein [Xanthomonas phage XAJ2]|uniref:Uncharacterized protein n=1 Tax=Xanthomonas phage XAJ2 TaxID=1775249 RepID=A0A1I9L2J1_9CAUD|nr:hypothetical protein [Xanthomonas phage XAJ2]
MADEIDQTLARTEGEIALQEAETRKRAQMIPAGHAGDCYYCGEWFSRVIAVEDPATGDEVDACGRCRDKRGIK